LRKTHRFKSLGFFWNSGRVLPSSADEIESIVRENCSDPRLLIDYFTWASAHRYPIDPLSWASLIQLPSTSISVVVIASLLQHLRIPTAIPAPLLKLIEFAFAILGLPYTEESVFLLLTSGHGSSWLLARNIIRAALARNINHFISIHLEKRIPGTQTCVR
jgi:hypothetical protein